MKKIKQQMACETHNLGWEIISDENYRKLVELSYSAITLLDKNLKIFYRSLSAAQMLGWTDIQKHNTQVVELVHHEDLEKVKMVIQQTVLFPNTPQTCEFRSRHANGHYIDIECAFTNMFDEPGLNAIVCNWHDITQRKEFERSLNQTNTELQNYKHALDECAIVAITDNAGKIIDVNDKFCKVSQYNREELLGHDHCIVNSGYHSKEFIKKLWSMISQGKVWRGEVRNKAKDGTFHWVDATIVPFLGPDGIPFRYVVIRFDITDRKNAEFELEKLNSELQQKYDQLKEISWLQSHIIRAPLVRIMGLIPLMKETHEEEKGIICDYVLQSAEELDNVIKKITNLSTRDDFEFINQQPMPRHDNKMDLA